MIKTYELRNEEDLHPIPLTAEILVKCGFVEEQMAILTKQFRYPKMSGNLSFIINKNIIGQWCFRIWDDSLKADITISIFEFFHQLQNLYFALTGEELNIEL